MNTRKAKKIRNHYINGTYGQYSMNQILKAFDVTDRKNKKYAKNAEPKQIK